MIITGRIDQISPRFYYKEGKKINYFELLVSYNFYKGINQILLLAKDFYLHSYKQLPKSEENPLIVVRTYFEKDQFEVLDKQVVKGRTKIFARFTPKNKRENDLYCYFWEDNHFLVDLNKVSKIQLNCRSLPYKDKFISNIEVWRTMENDNFLGSIL